MGFLTLMQSNKQIHETGDYVRAFLYSFHIRPEMYPPYSPTNAPDFSINFLRARDNANIPAILLIIISVVNTPALAVDYAIRS